MLCVTLLVLVWHVSPPRNLAQAVVQIVHNWNVIGHVTSRSKNILVLKAWVPKWYCRPLCAIPALFTINPDPAAAFQIHLGIQLTEWGWLHKCLRNHPHHFVQGGHFASCGWHVWVLNVKLLAPCWNLGWSNKEVWSHWCLYHHWQAKIQHSNVKVKFVWRTHDAIWWIKPHWSVPYQLPTPIFLLF